MTLSPRCSRRAALLAMLAMLAFPQPSQALPALDAIEKLNQTLLSVMKNASSLGYDGRYRRTRAGRAPTFDHAFMAQVMTGRFWAGFTAAQRDLLIATLRRFTAATYAARFDGYSGQMFEIPGEAPGPRDMVVVKTKIVSSPSDAVAIDYLMRLEGHPGRHRRCVLQSVGERGGAAPPGVRGRPQPRWVRRAGHQHPGQDRRDRSRRPRQERPAKWGPAPGGTGPDNFRT